MLNAFSQKPHPWGVEREERDAHKDGGRQKEVSPLIKIGIFYFGDEVSKQGHWKKCRQNFNRLYIFCCCILQKICEFLNCEEVQVISKIWKIDNLFIQPYAICQFRFSYDGDDAEDVDDERNGEETHRHRWWWIIMMMMKKRTGQFPSSVWQWLQCPDFGTGNYL